MNKFLFLFALASSSLLLSEAYADRDEDRRNEGENSNNYLRSAYDWSKRDPDSKDSNSSSEISEGTIPNCPDRDK